jgi:hypothetical protein
MDNATDSMVFEWSMLTSEVDEGESTGPQLRDVVAGTEWRPVSFEYESLIPLSSWKPQCRLRAVEVSEASSPMDQETRRGPRRVASDSVLGLSCGDGVTPTIVLPHRYSFLPDGDGVSHECQKSFRGHDDRGRHSRRPPACDPQHCRTYARDITITRRTLDVTGVSEYSNNGARSR